MCCVRVAQMCPLCKLRVCADKTAHIGRVRKCQVCVHRNISEIPTIVVEIEQEVPGVPLAFVVSARCKQAVRVFILKEPRRVPCKREHAAMLKGSGALDLA